MPVLLRKGYGFKDNKPELKTEIKKLQKLLKDLNFNVSIDGFFGENLEVAIKVFQRKKNLKPDGIVGKDTWLKILSEKNLKDFSGDTSWVHAREGHNGKPYWPGGASGVTLDPGIDLGYADPVYVVNLYSSILSEEQIKSLKDAYGLKGEAALAALSENKIINTIRLTRDQADFIFPYAAVPYWEKIKERFPELSKAPGCVQTALLSISYNRGPKNRKLEVLKGPISERNWLIVADVIGAMQQDHPLEGIRKRRTLEADYIRRLICQD